MYNRLIQQGVDFVFTYGNGSEEKREIYEYGFKLIFMYLISSSVLLLLAFLVGRFRETVLLLFALALQQSFAGGFHAMTYLRCFLLTLTGWAGSMLILPIIQSYHYLPCILAVVGLVFVFLLAPVKHENFPMSKEKELKMKRIARWIATLLCMFVFVFSIFIPQKPMLASVWGWTLFLSAVSIVAAVIKETLQNNQSR